MNWTDVLWNNRIAAEDAARLEEWRRAWDAYFGVFRPSLANRPGSKTDDNVAINYIRLIVDKAVAALFGQPFQFELGGGESVRTPAEAWLDACLEANGGRLLWQKLAINGAVCGHAFLKIAPNGGAYPRLVVVSPEYVRVTFEPDDIATVVRYVIQYTTPGANNKPVEVRQTIERDGNGWAVTDEMSVGGGAWQVQQAIQWPWPWPPIIDCQNMPSPNEYYGIADAEMDVLRLNEAINFVLSNIQRIIRYHAHPKTWGTGFSASALRVGADETIALPPGSTLQNLEMQSDLASSLAHLDRLKQALHEVAQVPEVALGKLDNVGALSGVALRILYQPLLDRTEVKRQTYGALIVELFRRLLDMAGFGANNIVSLHWPDILPDNSTERIQQALLLKQLGVSADTLLRELGYDPDAEAEKRQVEEAQTGEQLIAAFARGA